MKLFLKVLTELDAISDGMWELDVKNEKICLSPNAAKLLGHEHTLVCSQEDALNVYVHKDYRIHIHDGIKKLIKKQSDLLDIEIKLNPSSIECKWIHLKGVPISKDSDGTPDRLLGSITDITRNKKLEEDLISFKKKAVESEKLITAFLHNISHEIRTPLNAIVGFSSLLGEEDLSKDDQRSFIEILIKSSDHLLAIMSDIIEISKIETGVVRAIEDTLDLNEVLTDLFKQFSLDAERKKIKLKYTVGILEERTIIQSDKTKLVRIFSNLLSNSLKFTGSGEIKFGYCMNENILQFFVSDTGIGIPEDKYLRIFDRFFQVEHSENRFCEGTGLGLTISKAYVELLGGKIWLDSKVGEGTTFYFTINSAKGFNN